MSTVKPEPTQVIPIVVRDDALYVGATRVPLDTVISAFLDGASAEEIVSQYPSLQIADTYAVIGYYLGHRQELDEYLASRAHQSEMVRRENEKQFAPNGIRDRLLARQST